MTTEFKLGYVAGIKNENGFALDDKTPDFVAGFSQACRDVENEQGNPDTDSFDY